MPKGKRRPRTEAGEPIRVPHTTPQTLVVHWDANPIVYHGECNVARCTWRSANAMSKDIAMDRMRDHHYIHHT